ncbi:adenylate/guanylate cyclase domain-containing protein [Dactylosporangium matsuzakiense]|uniref:adenylate/guanylate cyclase domain-containing protein n=1 Tax=Dactylosporangium matsuzakiense TaxID=53360 RepID=UPI0021C4C71E|nr:adenylate/guanylate cyclase domain-containing protein [Dactylosporangium matsuzakiense]UWZ45447.1 AAA family ATPase [Dactylosporangium matsuzakiense]
MTCAVCGTVAVPGARFCHHCGSALPAAATLPAAERRIVTVLFGDLSDFTAWSEDLDPERVGAVTDRVLAALAGAVKTFGGHVDKLTGDGIMAVFGAPVAHEDDAERAVRAALSMQRAVRRVLDDERGGGAPLGLRIGLNTGPVVAGVQAGIEYTVIGDTVNTAARLADAAAIGAVYAGDRTSSSTRLLASWRALRPLRLKGKREPVDAFELLGLLDAPGTRSGLGDEAPFVGREPELGRVSGRLAEIADRQEPRVLVFTGEAGLGKTRLAGEIERFAAGYLGGAGYTPSAGFAPGGGARVLSVHCAAFGERRRLAPLADLVRAAIGLPPDAALTREAVEERLRRLAQRLARAARGRPEPPRFASDLLLTLIGYTEAVGDTAWVAPGGKADELDLDAVPAAVAELLSGLAAETPLVVTVDDLHDATPETLDALGAAIERLEGPVLIVLLGRPELVRSAGVLTRIADAEVVPIPPLRGADAARLLTAYLGGGRLAPADEDRLLATAQGNPFYLAELVTLLQERGALTTVAGTDPPGWRLAPGSLGGRLLSRDLAAVLAARIDALPSDTRAVLRDAAVIGDTVPARALEALRFNPPGQPARPAVVAAVELERAVEELLQRRMLRRGRGGFAFATPLLREAAYAGIGKADLAERHAALSRWASAAVTSFLAAGGTGNVAGLNMTLGSADAFIAEHAERAGKLADVVGLRPDSLARSAAPLGVQALGRAARAALASGEPAQAAQAAERAAVLGGGILPAADRLVHARALLQLGRSTEALGYAEKITANAGDDAAVQVGALLVAGRAYRGLGDHRRSYATLSDALEAATAAHLTYERGDAMRRLGMADFLEGRLAEAGGRFAESFQIAVTAGDRRAQAWSLQHLAWVTTTRGDFAGADAALGRAARRFAELGDPVGRAWLRGTTAFVRLLAGRLGEARRLAKAFLPFGERVGDAWVVGTLRAVEAFAAAESGDLAEADREARRAYREFAAAGDDWGRGLALVVRGVVARELRELPHAYDLLSDATEWGDKTGHPLLLGMSRTIRGFVSLDRGDPAAAEADARAVLQVVETHDVLDSATVGPRVLFGLARLAQGDLPTALETLGCVAAERPGPSVIFSRRQAVAAYAAALLVAGRNAEALDWARQAQGAPGEDVRGRDYAAGVLRQALEANQECTDDSVASAAIAAATLPAVAES